MKIDVVVPVLNGAKYIISALASINAQVYKPEKIIVVNDGSTDETKAMVEEYAKKTSTPIFLINQENYGLSKARNVGIRATNSEYIAFLDADDIWFPEKLEKQVKVFENSEYKNLSAVYCDYESFSDTEIIINKPITSALRGKIFEQLLESNQISSSASGILIKRSYLDKAGYFDITLRAFEDWDLWLRLAKISEFDFVPEKLVKIRKHTGNMQKKWKHMLTNEIIFYNKWSQLIPIDKVPIKWRSNLATLIYLLLPSLSSLLYIRKKLDRKLYKKYFPYGGIIIFIFIETIKKIWRKIK